MATKATTSQAQTAETTDESTDGPLMDGLGQEVKKLLAKAKERGYISIDELNADPAAGSGFLRADRRYA